MLEDIPYVVRTHPVGVDVIPPPGESLNEALTRLILSIETGHEAREYDRRIAHWTTIFQGMVIEEASHVLST